MQSTQSLLLVFEPALFARAREVAAGWASHDIEVRAAEGDPEQAAGEARLQLGGIPLGCLVQDGAGVVAALRGGADEAADVGEVGERGMDAFIDRMLVRANLRQSLHQRHGSGAHAEKLAALGTLVAGVSHEINNPLTALSLTLESLRTHLDSSTAARQELIRLAAKGDEVSTKALRELITMLGAPGGSDPSALVDEMLVATRSIADVVRDLRVFARTDEGEEPGVVELPQVIEQVLRMVGHQLTREAVVERDYGLDVPRVVAPRNRLTQVLMNLLVNAAHAIRDVERPMHKVRITIRTDDGFVALSIADTGPGIAPEALDRIFEPFFTTKREALGTGLGLTISRTILRSVGGDLLAESVDGEGATFVCLLPLPSDAALRQAMRRGAPSQRPSRPPPSVAVLVVGDDERVLRACARFLARECRVLVAHDGREAIDLLRSGSEVDAVLMELELPEVDGPALYLWLTGERPELAARTLVMGEDGSLPEVHRAFIERHHLPLLDKPLQAQALREGIAALFERNPK